MNPEAIRIQIALYTELAPLVPDPQRSAYLRAIERLKQTLEFPPSKEPPNE